MQNRNERAGRLARVALLVFVAVAAVMPLRGSAQMTTTTVQGTVYRADGTPAGGTLLISWPAFTTAQNQAVAAGNLNAAIGANGFVSVNLTPNAGALPSGSYYTATYHLNDGTVNQEFWVVPAAGTATVAAVRAQLQPATVAVPQAATSTYVQNAIASLSSTYVPLTGGTMSGALTLSGDPTAASQAATKHYADQLAAQNVPLSGGSLSGPLTVPTLFGKTIEGKLFADQWAGNGANNGIAMSLQQCRSLPYACQVLAPNLYALTEAQPFGGTTGDPQTTGPKSTDPIAQFTDERNGVPQYMFNGSTNYDSRHGSWPSYVMNWIGSAGLNGVYAHPGGALNIQANYWAGGHSFYNDKMNAQTLNIMESHYTQIQGGGSVGQGVACYANGDCVGYTRDTESFGGPSTASDEGNEGLRSENGEGGQVFSGTIGTISSAADGSVTLTTSSQVANGTQGEGRLVIDLTRSYNAGYITSFSNNGGTDESVTCNGSGCNWDGTFGTSTQTTLTAAVQNPVSGTNSFPQSNVTLQVGSSSGFAVGNLAGIFDYDYECEKITAVPDSTHITIATDRRPHPAGAYVTTGGLTCYAIEFEADRVTPGNTNGVSTLPDFGLSQTIRNAIPIMYSVPGNKLYFFQGYNTLPGKGAGYTGRAYPAMGGSGGSCTATVNGGAVTAVSVSGGTGYISSAYPPQIVFSGGWTTPPSAYITGVGSGAVTSAAVLSGGTGVTSATCSMAAENPYDIYPAAKTWSVYNLTAGAVDGTLYTEPFSGTIARGDTVEQPHYFLQHVGADPVHIVGQYIPSVGAAAHGAIGYGLVGIWQGNDTALGYGNNSDSTLFGGYPAPVNVIGRGQLLTPSFEAIAGAWRQIFSIQQPPFAPNPGYYPAVLSIGCGNINCSQWTTPWWMNAFQGVSQIDGWQANTSTDTIFGAMKNFDLTQVQNVNLGTVPVTAQGGLVSQLGQNWNPYSNALTQSSWSPAAGVTVSQDGTVADPFGGTQAVWKVQMTASNLQLYDNLTTNFTSGANVPGNVWLRGASGQQVCYNNANGGTCYTFTDTNVWHHIYWTATANSCCLNKGFTIYSNTGAQTFWIYNPVAEQGKTSSASALVNTTASSITTDQPINQVAGQNLCLADGTNCSAGSNPMTTLGDTIYGGASGVQTRLAGNTSASTLCLTQTGTGSVSAAPAWGSCSGTSSTNWAALIGGTNTGQAFLIGNGSSLAPTGTGTITATSLVAGAHAWTCQPGLGDGLNAIPAGTYLQTTCYNDTGSTVTISGVKCFTDNSGTSTMNVSGHTLGPLLTGAVTCSSSFPSGTQSANVALTNGDYLQFTFVADGATKQTSWEVKGTY